MFMDGVKNKNENQYAGKKVVSVTAISVAK
jgi:hypothetical protein